MISNKEAQIPNNLLSFAQKSPNLSAGIICANHDSSMESAKKAVELNLIEPIFIGDKNAINEKADKINWDISSYNIINSSTDIEAATIGAELAKDNKIKIMIKGNLHTDILMKTYLKKDFGLIEGKRLSHIWHMTINKDDKPLFITDGALNVAPRLDVKMHILKNVINFANQIDIMKPRVAILSEQKIQLKVCQAQLKQKNLWSVQQKKY